MNEKLAKAIVANANVLVVKADELEDVIDDLDLAIVDTAGGRMLRFRSYEVVIDRG